MAARRNTGALQKHYRRGPDHRQGVTVDFGDVFRRFEFRSIQVGRWVTQEENREAAPRFYDALCDLMTILGGPESLVSLRGTLSLRYGSGGRPGVAAHYEPGTRAFALAKNAGPGSIAHEWFHAFDHYLADKAFSDARPGMFASRAWLKGATAIVHPLNDLLLACFRAIFLEPDDAAPSALVQTATLADRSLGQRYYSLPEEICARAFEAFVQDAAIRNSFLVRGARASAEAEAGLYPKDAQRQRINHAFASYFRRLGGALLREHAGAVSA